jgi:UDPglucose 6-dehydrogenase
VSHVAVIGAGYVGITSAACLARFGHEVVCGDVDAAKVARLTEGEIPILEDGLPVLVEEGLSSGRLRFVVGAAAAVEGADFVFLCVPTPHGDSGAADLSVVQSVAREIAPALRPGAIVVNKSTMPVGSTRMVARELSQHGAPNDVGVASNPEFLREGSAVSDFLQPDRIVIGCDDTSVAVRVTELYDGVHAPVIVTDPASAEMIKYASNSFLATKISFINAVANLCEVVNADVRDVALGMGYDHRIGSAFLEPGPGYGGSCFPKDVAALIHTAQEAGYEFGLLRGAVEVNAHQHDRVVQKIVTAAGGSLQGVRVGVWGLTFKADTDDLRDSPAVAVTRRLVADGALVRAYDPTVEGDSPVDGVEIVGDAYAAVEDAPIVVLLTEWDEFRWLDFRKVAGSMTSPRAVVDARNLLDPPAMRRMGFAYQGVGR